MRGKRTPKRKLLPDPKFNSITIAKFINKVMTRGKKSVAQKVVYDCFDVISEKTKKDPIEIFDLALKKVMPEVEVRSRRVGGANYQIPVAVPPERKLTLSLRWLIGGARQRKGASMREKLAQEIIDASNNIGGAIKKRENIYRMAEANRAFAHFIR